MATLTLEEARELAKTFGELDQYDAILLLFFVHTTNKWDLIDTVEKLPKSYRIPQATLYRRVKSLYGRHFLDLVSSRTGRAGMAVESYRLSLKGLLACGIVAYETFLDPTIPATIKEKTQAEQLAQELESSAGPGWALYLDLLKWHRERQIDLSKAKVDMLYFGFSLALSMFDHPEAVTTERMRDFSAPFLKLGLPLKADPETWPALFKDAKKAMEGLGSSFIFGLFEKLKQLDSGDGRDVGT
jgi:hypothetical protein